jgi:hypothetical protein
MLDSPRQLRLPDPVARLGEPPKARSSLVRRLVRAHDDPAKRRIRAWLSGLADEKLTGLGLTPADIAILRGGRADALGAEAQDLGVVRPNGRRR